MDTHSQRPDDLSEMERQLAAWTPAPDGLDADAMLFAAGRASARPGLARFLWPALATCAGAFVVVLGVWLSVERSERRNLAQQLQQRDVAPLSNPSPTVSPPQPASAEEWPPDSYVASRPALEKGLDAWPPRAVSGVESSGAPGHETPTFKVRSLNGLLAQ
jgi:hypothetical protein